MRSDRNAVYNALDGERRYQFNRFGDKARRLGEFVLYAEQYLEEAKSVLTYLSSPDAELEALSAIRKFTALGVAAMEQHGAVTREDEERAEREYHHKIMAGFGEPVVEHAGAAQARSAHPKEGFPPPAREGFAKL